MVRGYPLTTSPPLPTTMKRHVACQKDEGGKPRLYKTKGKSGCRVYVGRKYVGYFASKKAANDAIHKPLVEQTPERTAQKAYKYV